MAFSLVPLGVIGVSVGSALITEVLLWLFIYRTQHFQTLKANIEKHSKKLETAKDGPSGSKGSKKKEAKLEAWREEAAKHVVGNNFKSGIIVMACMLLTFRVVTKLFSGVAVARLPFNPPPFVQKLTHRGLTGADPQECSALFIFILCQGSIKIIITKLLGWGPTREMAAIKPHVPRALKTYLDSDKQS